MNLSEELQKDIRRVVNEEAARQGRMTRNGDLVSVRNSILGEWTGYFIGLGVDLNRVAESLLGYYERLCGGSSDAVGRMKDAGYSREAIVKAVVDMEEFRGNAQPLAVRRV